MICVGDLEIHLIDEGDYLVDPGGVFGLVPRALWSREMPPVDHDFVPMHSNCLLVRTGGKTILIDNGMGENLDERAVRNWQLKRTRGGMRAALARLGLTPADIDLVINTHLHSDHCGGNVLLQPDGTALPAFPNAEHVVQRREYQDACQPNERTRGTYFAHNFEPLVRSGQLRLLDGDTELAPGVRGVVMPGHTPGHMGVVFESGGESAVFVCDMASYAVHFERLSWMTAYDVEPLVTLESKRRWQAWALQTNAVIIFAHEPHRPAGRLTQDAQGRLKVVALDEPYA